AMIGSANNSLISLPDSRHVYECMKELEFFVYIDVFMTPTASLADIILPAALWPELECVFTMPEFCEHTVLCQQKLVQVGECRSDEEIFLELCKRMGVDYGAESHREILDEALRVMGIHKPEMEGLTFDKLAENGYYTPKREYYNYKRRGGFNTPTGKFELYSMEIKNNGGDPLPFWQEPPETMISRPELAYEYPYVMSTGSRRLQYFISNNRQITSLRRQYPFPLVKMHPDTARDNGIEEGDWVYIETPRGRITQKAKLEKDMDKRVINCDFAWWYPEAGAPDYGWRESNANILTSDSEGVDSYMGSYQLRGILCKIYKNDNCHIEERYYKSKYWADYPPDQSSRSVMIDHSKCVLCGECVRICRDVQGVGALEIVTRDGVTLVTAKGGGTLSGSQCVGCGQCRSYCAEDALRIRSDVERVEAALKDENSFVVAQIAPSLRVGISGEKGFENVEDNLEKIVGALKKLGFDRVYDTLLSADLTVVEESKELLSRLENGGKLPLFTSCCPAWVKFCENRWSKYKDNISSCRSPQQMLGAVIRERNRMTDESGGKKLVSVSVMPCTAKKQEIIRPDSMSFGEQDIDISITTMELLELLERHSLSGENCEKAAPDAPFSIGSGSSALFGNTGGVTLAVLRHLSHQLGEGEVRTRHGDGYISHEVKIGGKTIRAAVVSGLRNADRLMKRIDAGIEKFHIVEVMACTGGCVMGAGQPADVYDIYKNRASRTAGLQKIDAAKAETSSGENPALKSIYEEIICGREHELLHCER
ncbi:MAG: molybdopterin-dependent oxidoreductase, partial [Oscillospiraceae bacterium]|nr:molybdopterin-dependent oxidoreductase [Oscillospiraceae bacterium]